MYLPIFYPYGIYQSFEHLWARPTEGEGVVVFTIDNKKIAKVFDNKKIVFICLEYRGNNRENNLQSTKTIKLFLFTFIESEVD